MGKEAKTNAMRILDKNKIPYEMNTYTCDELSTAAILLISWVSLMNAVSRHWSLSAKARIISYLLSLLIRN